MTKRSCRWCSTPFSGRAHKRFCSDSCRAAFHRAARRYVLRLMDAGFLTVEMLKMKETTDG
jgi:predicted nucleic acid-binding Zn ribbon protein